MSLNHALLAMTALMALAFIQQSLEHAFGSVRRAERWLFFPRLLLALLLLASVALPAAGLTGADRDDLGDGRWTCALACLLLVNQVAILRFFNGPYNGGADRMGTLILTCVALGWSGMGRPVCELAVGYLAIQLTLSYAMSGWVKVVNPAWRNGQALYDVFAFSAYPVTASVRRWAKRPDVLCIMSWAVMLFELSFPLALVSQSALIGALCLAAVFHGANAWLFGLNRFLWIWMSAYPSILWLQGRIGG